MTDTNDLANPVLPAEGGLPGMVERATELLSAGGPVVAILIVMSVFSLTLVLLKLWQFRVMRVGDRRTVQAMLACFRAGRDFDALGIGAGARNPIAQTLAIAIQGLRRGDVPEAVVREEVVRFGGDRIEELRGYLRPLEVVGSLAPLLGLFGTVLGMISAFQQLEQAGNNVNPAILSGGIWEALLTTAVGLAVAIPVVAAVNWFERVVERLTHDMESAVTQIFTVGMAPTIDEVSEYGSASLKPAAAFSGS
jgi:biopolymer transport protein ExbB